MQVPGRTYPVEGVGLVSDNARSPRNLCGVSFQITCEFRRNYTTGFSEYVLRLRRPTSRKARAHYLNNSAWVALQFSELPRKTSTP
jgi:hypothetical protein